MSLPEAAKHHRENGSETVERELDLRRIEQALQAAGKVLEGFQSGATLAERKAGRGIVTAADRQVNERLREVLTQEGEGWLSEETTDDLARLQRRRVWIVDPLDGTQEFVAGIPEWCVSIGLVEDGRAVVGGISNPATGEVFLGSVETGVTRNGKPVAARASRELQDMLVLASHSEARRREWTCLRDAPFRVQPMGSVAYKLARVAAGLADAVWTFTPKHEWDVVAGVALVQSAGGLAVTLDGQEPAWNRPQPFLKGLMAFSAEGAEALLEYLRAAHRAAGLPMPGA